jgi:hypothetical protein
LQVRGGHMPRVGVRNVAPRSACLRLGEPPEGAERRLSTAILAAALLSIAVCVGLLAAPSSAAAQAQAGPPQEQGGDGFEPAAQVGDRPPAPTAPGGPAVRRPETSSTGPRDQTPATSDHEVHSTLSPPGPPLPDDPLHEGSRGPDTSRGDRAPRGPGDPSKVPPAPPAVPGPTGRADGGSNSGQPANRPAPPAGLPAAKTALPPSAAPRSSDNSGEASSDIPTDGRGSPSETSTSLESSTAVAPSVPAAPTLPIVAETHHRGSVLAVMREAAGPAKALHPGRAHTALEIVPAPDAARTPVATPLAVRAEVGHTAVPPTEVAPQQPRAVVGMSTAGPSAGSSSSSSAGLLGLISALLFLFLVHWSSALLVPERWARTVFLALPARPG